MISKKDAELVWTLITNAQHTAWIEGWSMGEGGGEKNRNPYPKTGDIEDVMNLYRLMKGK